MGLIICIFSPHNTSNENSNFDKKLNAMGKKRFVVYKLQLLVSKTSLDKNIYITNTDGDITH